VILEHAALDVIPGREAEFESAFADAKTIIASMPGFVSLRLMRGIERPSSYLLLVEWERLEDHTEGFRGSAEYQQWRSLLHHFYDPFPTVEHYQPVTTG
jgi:heme-degrading monooxygenase HmoA